MKDYYNRHGNLMLGGGVLTLALGAFAAMSSGAYGTLGTGLLLLAVGIATRSTPVVRLGADRVEIRPAALRGKTIVPLSAIQRLDEANPKVLVLETASGKVKVPLTVLSEGDRAQLLQGLRGAGRG